MTTTNFHASAKYGDWKGTASADDHDHIDFRDYLKSNGYMKDGEFLVGIETSQAEVAESTLKNPLYVSVLIVESTNAYDTVAEQVKHQVPLQVRRERLRLNVEEFFGLFKRFEISISPHGLIDQFDVEYQD